MASYQKKRRNTDPSYKKLKADYFPAQRTVQVGSQGAVVGSIQVVDVARYLSVVNHRLYRQGKMYQVKLDIDNEVSTPGTYEVYALSDTWMTQKAWQTARQAYEDAMSDERATVGQQAARWEDFRVGAGLTGGFHESVPYVYDGALAGAPDLNGEFQNSRVTKPDGSTQLTFTWGATSSSNYGILEEYDKVDNTDSDPSIVSGTGAYAGLEPGNHEIAADDLKGRGNQPPYDGTNMRHSPWVKVGELHNAGTGSQRLSTGYFNAPCGLVVIKTPTPNKTLTGEISMVAKSGSYKGVAGHNMGV